MKSTRTITILTRPVTEDISSQVFGNQTIKYESRITFVKDINENGARQYWCRITKQWSEGEEILIKYINLTGKPEQGNGLYKQYRGMGYELKDRYTLNIDDSENWKYN